MIMMQMRLMKSTSIKYTTAAIVRISYCSVLSPPMDNHLGFNAVALRIVKLPADNNDKSINSQFHFRMLLAVACILLTFCSSRVFFHTDAMMSDSFSSNFLT